MRALVIASLSFGFLACVDRTLEIGQAGSSPQTPTPTVSTPTAPSSAQGCGGRVASPCPGREFCDPPEGCAIDQAGTCVPANLACGKDLAPVCGCDGVTYGNDCLRQKASIGRAHVGACEGDCAAPSYCGCDDCPTLCKPGFVPVPSTTCGGGACCTIVPD
jgi:hypothetical protein